MNQINQANQTNQLNQINRIDQINRINQIDIKNPMLDSPKSEIINFLFSDLKYKILKINTAP